MTLLEHGYNVTTGIVSQLGTAIVTGKYGEKNPFPIEAELCRQLGVSRSVLREAVKMLTAKGLLVSRPRHGTSVQAESMWNLLDPDVLRWLLERKFSLELLAQFTEVRLAVEPMAAMLAARKSTPSGLAKIREAVERMRAAARGEDDPLESDIAFHVAVLAATGNRFYARLEGVIDAALRTSIQFTNQYKGVALADVNEHRKVFDAIEARDPQRAGEIMEKIIHEVMDLIASARHKSRSEKPTARVRALERST
ncbi:MAG: FadR/GntR family transcriptional regulator [Povalibacter sp.]